MKHLYSKLLLLSAFVAMTINAQAQTTSNAILSFLKEKPKTTKTDCTGEDLMALLTDESLNWIEGIECENISLDNEKAGVTFNLRPSEGKSSAYMKFLLKKTPLMKTIRVIAYGVDLDNEGTTIEIKCNDNNYNSGSFIANKTTYDADCSKILDGITGKDNSISIPSINKSEAIDPLPLTSVTLSIPEQTRDRRIQFYGIRVYYQGTTDVVPTGVADIVTSDETTYEYFDMMGRRLPGIPDKGIYIRKCGNKVEKLCR